MIKDNIQKCYDFFNNIDLENDHFEKVTLLVNSLKLNNNSKKYENDLFDIFSGYIYVINTIPKDNRYCIVQTTQEDCDLFEFVHIFWTNPFIIQNLNFEDIISNMKNFILLDRLLSIYSNNLKTIGFLMARTIQANDQQYIITKGELPSSLVTTKFVEVFHALSKGNSNNFDLFKILCLNYQSDLTYTRKNLDPTKKIDAQYIKNAKTASYIIKHMTLKVSEIIESEAVEVYNFIHNYANYK